MKCNEKVGGGLAKLQGRMPVRDVFLPQIGQILKSSLANNEQIVYLHSSYAAAM